MADDTAMMDNDPDAPSGGADSFATGQSSTLHKAVRNNAQALINVRDNHKVRLHHSHSFVHTCEISNHVFLSVFFIRVSSFNTIYNIKHLIEIQS